ncbi:hypothetical protein [Pseudidiomarina sediminum]|uniref:hypothetical protein n=1 Tax=Pseudidiomarina sediminum TaxID=431675 RepID=UPI001C94615E|nr:hypothetical protein [Pseudidiomarina sediminum]MBY6062901.1 hypothetical protein [Pseudidiomarina sediminum]
MIADLDLAAAEQTAGSIVSGGGTAAAMKCDVTDPEKFEAIFNLNVFSIFRLECGY